MSEVIIGDEAWKQLTEVQKTEVVHRGGATLRQLTQGLLDGPEELRAACREFLIHTSNGLDELPLTPSTPSPNSFAAHSRKVSPNKTTHSSRPKCGLPKDFVPRPSRSERSRLLLENIYRLPNGQEFVPVLPSGALGGTAHQYALLSLSQYQQHQRGSIYVRADGRIFDYSRAESASLADFFDTGFTIADLQRTGHYATKDEVKRSRNGRKPIQQKSKASNA
jgi:hypothetical protein